jgi:hypothetical protein
MSVPSSIYNCSQQNLYAIVWLAWANYSDNQADFEGKYTADYATDAVAAIVAAKALPTKQGRNAVPEAIRQQLVPLGEPVWVIKRD